MIDESRLRTAGALPYRFETSTDVHAAYGLTHTTHTTKTLSVFGTRLFSAKVGLASAAKRDAEAARVRAPDEAAHLRRTDEERSARIEAHKLRTS